jgi:hypothetical protein
MALITPSALISEIRGSVGDTTFSRVRTGPIARMKPAPYLADTPAQLAWQARFNAAITAWQALDEPTRLEFIVAAKDRIKMQRLGYKRSMSGYSLFVSRYLLATKSGTEGTVYPLAKKMDRKYQIMGISLDASAFEIAINNPGALSSTKFSIFATPKVNPGRVSLGSNFYRLIIESDSLTSGITVYDVSAAYEAKFEDISLTVGYRVGLGLQCFNNQTGERTALFSFNQVVNP